ncbi:MAG: penicillin-binding protein activator [Deltaproteobacteria bacterium]|nr:penicillin-binding protein activator [Deltaproteobacteria bacterium]
MKHFFSNSVFRGLSVFLLLLTACAQIPIRRDPPQLEVNETAAQALKKITLAHREKDLSYIEALKTFLATYPDTLEAQEAKFEIAQAYYTQNLISEASKTLEELDPESLAQTMAAKVYYLSALTARKLELYYEMTRYQIEFLKRSTSAAAHEKVKQEILSTLETHLDIDRMEALLSEYPQEFPAGELHYYLGKHLFDQGNHENAESHFTQALEQLSDEFQKEKISRFLAEIHKTYSTQKHVIGCILPLSGKYASYGEKSLKGLQLALDFFSETSTKNFELAIYDSQGDPQKAEQGVSELLEKHGVMAIVGPLLQSTSEGAAKRAQQLHVPFINLSQHPTLLETGDFIFQISMTKKQEVRALVHYACEQQGLKKFAILYPEDPYGIDFVNLFWDAVESCGGEVVAAEVYASGQKDFNQEIKKLVGLQWPRARTQEYTSEEARLKMVLNRKELQEKEVKLSPIVDFEALFIPDHVKAIGQIAPTLAYYDVEHVLLLGSESWNSPELVTRGQHYIEGAVFVDGFFPHSGNPQIKNFVKQYQTIFGEIPQIWQAQAYDAMDLLTTLLSKEDVDTREKLKNELTALTEIEGVTGRLLVLAPQQIQKELVLLTVKNQKITTLSE